MKNLLLRKEPERVPRAELHGHKAVQCLSKGSCQSPADASSTEIYLARHLCRNCSYFDWCKTFALFLLPLFFGVYLVRGPVFLPGVARPSSSVADGEAMRLPSFSPSPCVRDICSGTAVLGLKHIKCFPSVLTPHLSNEYELLKKINRPIHSKYCNCWFLLPCVLSLLQQC